jgi:type IV pilus assembly protein PilN
VKIALNLATRPFADLGPSIKRLRIAMGVLVFIAILLGVGLHAIHRSAEAARARDHSLDGQIAHITQEREGYTRLMQQPPNAQLLEQAAVLNKLIDAKAFSWTLAMEDLETVLPGGVQVTTLEPERGKDGRITVRLRVVGPRSSDVDLVRNLEHSRRFLQPRIVGENADANAAPGQKLEPVSASDRVQFDMLATYNPATSAERDEAKAGKKSGDDAGAVGHGKIKPLPLHPTRQGRAPYAGHSDPSRPQHAKPVPAPPGGAQ